MITQERPAFYANDRYAEYAGLSTDNKSTIKAYNGDEFYEINTGKTYKYDEDGAKWVEQPASGGGGGTGDLKADGSVPMTGNLQMNGNAIMGVKSISNTNSGLAIESETSLNNHKITDLLDPTAEQDATTKKYVDAHDILGDDGKVKADIDMNEHAIINAHKISTDGPAPLYIGSTIEATGTTAPRLTGATDGTAAFVKADTQAEYVAIAVGTPTAANHATTKEYVDTRHQAEYTIIKKTDTTTGNFATYQLQKDGVDEGEAINIPLDYLVKSVEVKIVPAGGDDSGFTEGTQYVDFTINAKAGTGDAEHLYLKTTDICKPYTSGSVANDPIVVAISDENKITATITDKGIVLAKLSDDVQTSLSKADTALQAADITTGVTNGTIKVKDGEVSVFGLGTSAYADTGVAANNVPVLNQDAKIEKELIPELDYIPLDKADEFVNAVRSNDNSINVDKNNNVLGLSVNTNPDDTALIKTGVGLEVAVSSEADNIIEKKTDGLYAAKNGADMTKAVYDADNAVADAGGVKDYVSANYLPITGGTLKGNLYIAPDNTSSIIFATMGSGAVVQFKDSEANYLNATIDTASSAVRVSSGASQDPITIRGLAEPQLETDAVNLKYLTDNYVALAGSKFTFPGMTMVENVATPESNYQATNKYYVDEQIDTVKQVPADGTKGQVLTKTDTDTYGWADAGAGGGAFNKSATGTVYYNAGGTTVSITGLPANCSPFMVYPTTTADDLRLAWNNIKTVESAEGELNFTFYGSFNAHIPFIVYWTEA